MTTEEFTPRELGLLAGARWADGSLEKGDVERVRMVGDDDIGPKLYDEIMALGFRERLTEFSDPEAAELEFWRGFAHGARGSLVQNEIGRLARSN